jgi:hypothetical protein
MWASWLPSRWLLRLCLGEVVVDVAERVWYTMVTEG